MTTIAELVVAGDYTTKLPYPKRPAKPGSVTSISARVSTSADLEKAAADMKEYEALVTTYNSEMEAYRADVDRLREKLHFDLAYENAFMFGSRGESALWLKAWEDGHSDGLHAVANIYDALADLVNQFAGGGSWAR